MVTRKGADHAWEDFPKILARYMTGPPAVKGGEGPDPGPAQDRALWFQEFPDHRVDPVIPPPRVTIRELASRLKADLGDQEDAVSIITAWRKGRSRPHLRLLPAIAIEIGAARGDHQVDPALLLRRMGVLPDPPSPHEHVLEARRLQRLQLELAAAESRMREFGRTGAAASVVAACQRSGHWAIGVWPVYEGPEGFKLHVADRLDLRRLQPTDGRDVPHYVREDPFLKPALRAVHATPSSAHPRWTTTEQPADTEFWSIHHVAAPRSPTTRAWPKLHSIFCYSLTEDAWVHDVGALLAMTIGYGLTATRDLALDIEDVTDPGEDPRASQTAAMRQAHASLAQKLPQRRVWTHHGDTDDLLSALGHGHPEEKTACSYVWLRETDAFLAGLAGRDEQRIRRDRDRLDSYLLELQAAAEPTRKSNLVVIDVEPVHETETAARRNAQWGRALQNVMTILQYYLDKGFLPTEPGSYKAIHDRLVTETGVGDVLIGWLSAQEKPFPSTGHRPA